VLGEANPNSPPALPPGASAEAAFAPVPSAAHPALRHFRPGSSLAYSYVIYNARPGRANGRPQLTTQARLFREGREVFATPETPFDAGAGGGGGGGGAAAAAGRDATRLDGSGTLTLRPDAPPGSYVLQLIVNDTSPGHKRQTTTQWIDFEVVR
jgi:hypothetical protein